MAEEERKVFKKKSLILVIFQIILIALTVVSYLLRDIEIGSFSMNKLCSIIIPATIIFGIFVSVYIIFGLIKYSIVNTNFASKFVKKINYRILMIIIFSMMIIGTGFLIINLYLVSGDILALTWGSLILGILGLGILGITLFLGIFLIIEQIKI